LKIRIVYPNGRGAGMHLRVRLMSGFGSTLVAESYTTDGGMTQFTGVPVGNYHVMVTGEGIEDTDSGVFEVDQRRTTQSLLISVRPVNESNNQFEPGSPLVAVVNLNVPASARKEFDKANEAVARQDWTKALQRLNRAISIYPEYASAYNNLGVVYSRMNDFAHEREALEKAISLNDHFVQAFVNLAKLCFRENNFRQAETLLERATRAEPTNAETLTLLAKAQLLNQHYDAAIASAHSVHALPHQGLAVAHYIAARAFEHENRPQDALAEFQTFLMEEPEGARAAHVRDEMAQIQHRMR
jgi:tetratricopeptide (TPR) repeat protein